MGWGSDVWDWMSQSGDRGGVDPEEERRRRLREQAMAPVQEVEDLTSFEQPEVIQAPDIRGTEDSATSDILGEYRGWAGRRPAREDYKASTGRKILGGLLGFLTGMGGNVQQGRSVNKRFVEGKYRDALEDWESEGKSLGEVGAFAQDISKTRQQREGQVLGYEGTQDRVEAQRSAIGQRREAEDLRHQDRMAGLTEDSQKRSEVGRHNKELEKLAGEANRIRNIEAGASVTSAGAYKSQVDKLNEGQAGVVKALPAHFRQAVMDEISQMIVEYPDYEKYFRRNPKNPNQIFVRPGVEMAPVDAQRFRAFIEDAKVRAKRTLDIPEETDVDEYNPLRQDVP